MAAVNAKQIRLIEGYICHEAVDNKKKKCTKTTNHPLFSTLSLNPNTLITKLSTVKSLRSEPICSHDLPSQGFCTLSRIQGERKKLLLQTLTPSISNEKSSLLFTFQTIDDLLTWEKKLRSHLEVYSYEISDVKGLLKEPISGCTLHITSVYIAITMYNTKGGIQCIAKHLARGSSIQYIIFENNDIKLEIIFRQGESHKYMFKTDHAASIKKAIEIFHKLENSHYQSLTPSTNDSTHNSNDRYTAIYKMPNTKTSNMNDDDDTDVCAGCVSQKTNESSIRASTTLSENNIISMNTTEEEEYYVDLENLNLLDDNDTINVTPIPIRSSGLKQGRTRKEPTENIDHGQIYINQYKKTIPSAPNLYCYINDDDGKDFSRKGKTSSNRLSIVKVNDKVDLESRTHHRYPHWQPTGMESRIVAKHQIDEVGNIESGNFTKTIDLTICVMASEAVSSEFWVIGVVITRRQDEALMKKLVDIEKETGRHMVTNKIPLEADTNIQLAFQKCPDGFEELSTPLQIVQFDDLKKLSDTSWLVVEFHFHHEDSQQSKFISVMNMKPANNVNETSRFKNYDVRICQLFKTEKVEKQSIKYTEQLQTTEELKPEEIKKTSNPEHCILFRLASDKANFCQKLDQFHPLNKDWKAFASELGLTKEDVNHISESRGSYMEQVLLVLETSCSPDCTIKRFQDIANSLNRKDLLPYLS